MASLLPPEDAVLERVAPEARLVAASRLAAEDTTASLSKAGKSASCSREHAVSVAESAGRRAGTTAAPAELEQTRAGLRARHADRKRIK